jgi:twitching motility protein PilT
VTLLDSLLDAIVRLDGDALVMHAGEKPYVVLSSASMNTFRGPLAWGQVELSSRPLTADAVLSMLAQMLSPEQSHTLEEFGAIEHEIDAPGSSGERFVVTAARGGEDVWVEVRRRSKIVEAPPAPVGEAVAHTQPHEAIHSESSPLPPAVPATAEAESDAAVGAEPDLEITVEAEEDAVHEISAGDSDVSGLDEEITGAPVFEIAVKPPSIQREASRVTDEDDFESSAYDLEADGALLELTHAPHGTGSERIDSEGERFIEEQAEIRVREIAEQKVVEIAEQKVAALAERKVGEIAEQQIARLAEQQVARLAEQQVAAIAGQRVREAAEERVAEIADQKVHEAAERRVAALADQKITELAHQRISELAERKIVEAAEQRVASIAEQKVGELAERRIGTVAEERVAQLAERKIAEVVEQTVTHVANQKVAELAVQTVVNVANQKVAEVAEQTVLQVAEQKVAEVAEQTVAHVAERTVAQVAEVRVAQFAEQTVAHVAEVRVTEFAERTVAHVAEQKVAEFAEHTVAHVAEHKVAQIAEQTVARVAQQKVGELAEQTVAEIAAQQIAEIADLRVTELAEQKIAEIAERTVAELASRRILEIAGQKVAELAQQAVAEIADAKVTAAAEHAAAALQEREAAEIERERASASVLVPHHSVFRRHQPQPIVPAEASQEASLVELLRAAASYGASTLYAVVDTRPMMRVDGQISVVGTYAPIAAGEVERFVFEFAARDQVADAAPEWACTVPDVGRVRCVTFRDHSGSGLICHLAAAEVSPADDIGLPEQLQSLCAEADGLVIVAGPRSSGKSTMLGAFVDFINATRYDHVITIESQILKVHEKGLSLISQREVRGDGDAIASAARAALREGPDVLVIEDLRAPEALVAALDAARAGRLVFGSISARTAPAAIERLIDGFPADRRSQVRASLAGSLRSVIAQVLVPKPAGGRVAAREILLTSPAVRKLVLDGAIDQLPIAIESGRALGMRTMVDALGTLVRDAIVEIGDACASAPDRRALVAALEREGINVTGTERRA